MGNNIEKGKFSLFRRVKLNCCVLRFNNYVRVRKLLELGDLNIALIKAKIIFKRKYVFFFLLFRVQKTNSLCSNITI